MNNISIDENINKTKLTKKKYQKLYIKMKIKI